MFELKDNQSRRLESPFDQHETCMDVVERGCQNRMERIDSVGLADAPDDRCQQRLDEVENTMKSDVVASPR